MKPKSSHTNAFIVRYPTRLRQIEFLGDKIVESIKVGFLHPLKGSQLFLYALYLRTEILVPKTPAKFSHIQRLRVDLCQQFFCIRFVVMHLHPILRGHNAVSQGNDLTHLRPCSTSRIKQRITGIEQVRALLFMRIIHTELQYSHIKQHLHPIVFFGKDFVLVTIFIGLTRFHFDKATHITLHIVQPTLYAQGFTDVGGFKNSIALIEPIYSLIKGMLNRIAQMVEVHPAIVKESLFFQRIPQFLTSSQFYRILAESLLHGGTIIG